MREVTKGTGLTVGLDLGDRFSRLLILDGDGQVTEEGRVATREGALRQRFAGCPPMRIALETGTHSPWVSRVLKECGHEVIVANSRKLRLIYENPSKDDRVDALYLARVARVEPALLAPVVHRGEATQKDLTLLRSRDVLVRSRTQLINHVRGIVKSVGSRLPACSSRAFSKKVSEKMPESLRPGLLPVLEEIASLSDRMKKIEKQLETLGDTVYPQTKLLRQVTGVGLITSLGFVLTLETPQRFQKSRTVAAFLELVPGRSNPAGQIPKGGSPSTGTASCGSFSSMPPTTSSDPSEKDSDLRRFGLRIASRGGKVAKKKAIVAVARKLAVLLHHLWRSGEIYEPFYQENHKTDRGGKAA